MTLPPFDTVVREHGPLVHRTLLRVVGPGEADDCWQETFVAALGAYPRLRPDSNVRGWLLTIAHRKAVDALRRRTRDPAPAGDDLPDAPGRGPAPATTDPAEIVPDAVDAAHGVWAAVGRLPDKQRLAVAYRFGADLGYPDVAALLGTSEAAARRNVFEGLRTLRGRSPAPAGPAPALPDHPRPGRSRS